MAEFQDIFQRIDADSSGDITMVELETLLQDEALHAYFAHLNLEIEQAWDIFRIIDRDKSGTVSIDEFVDGCLRLRGNATTMDLAQVIYDTRSIQQKLSEFMWFVEEQFHQVQLA